jgi:membrane protein
VLSRYDRAGGGLLAGGLAYSALFAIVPLALIGAGLTGLLVRDPVVRVQVIATITDVLPPLQGLVNLVLTEAAGAAGTLSIIGAATLVWGGSRFILAFEEATVRIAGGSRTRSLIARNVFGLGAVLVLVGAVILAAVVAAMAAFFDAAASTNGFVVVSLVTQLTLAVLPLLLAIGGVSIVYRYVFEVHPSWRAVWRPSWIVALILTIVARLFVYIAPRLIGAAAAIGALATAFAALAWLGISFQAILIGAAWVSERTEREAGAKAKLVADQVAAVAVPPV